LNDLKLQKKDDFTVRTYGTLFEFVSFGYKQIAPMVLNCNVVDP